METVYAEFSSYDKMVEALFSPDKKITYPTVQFHDSLWTTSAIQVGKASLELKQIGFSPMFFYNKEHFEAAPIAESSAVPHSHGLSIKEMLALKEMLNNPCLIAVSKDKENAKGDIHKALELLYYDKESQSFYMMAVMPNASIDNIFASGKANLILTYFKMSDLNVSLLFKGIDEGRVEVLAFDKSKIPEEDLDLFPQTLANGESFSHSVRGKTIDCQEPINIKHKHVDKAVTKEAQRIIDKSFDYNPVTCSTFWDLNNVLNNATSIRQLLLARDMCKSILKHSQEYALSLQKEFEERLASKYVSIITAQKDKILTKFSEEIESLKISSVDEIDTMYELIDCIEGRETTLRHGKIPTLNNIGLQFDFDGENVKAARALSEKVLVEIRNELSNIAQRKSDNFYDLNPDIEHD